MSTAHFKLVSGRIREIRVELYGEAGGPVLAEAVGVPARTWSNYEQGVIMPADVLLKFFKVTKADPLWLLAGEGQKYQGRRSASQA